MKAIRPDVGRIRAEGTVVSIGRRVAFAEARLLDDWDVLYATASSSLLVIPPPAA